MLSKFNSPPSKLQGFWALKCMRRVTTSIPLSPKRLFGVYSRIGIILNSLPAAPLSSDTILTPSPYSRGLGLRIEALPSQVPETILNRRGMALAAMIASSESESGAGGGEADVKVQG